ncbi:sulfatase [Rhodothermaceae bacterium RA]|nr:sulfatase [Rhodothermaceae bacterium RA]
MSRLHFGLVLGGLFLCAACRSGSPDPALPPPNIVWISAEDLSPRLGAYGDTLARTPNLDRFAVQSLRYTRAFTTAGVCAPSRAAIITGMFQPAIGAHHMRTSHEAPHLPGPYEAVPPPHVKAFPEYLRAAGYYTTNNVKTDYQFGTPRTVWDENSRQAHWRNRPDPDQPFFAVFNFTVTHESQVWPRDKPVETDPAAVAVPPYYPDTPVVRRDLAQHYDNIATLDSLVGVILRQLEEDGLADNTVVFFWTDHGDGLPRAKRWLYDAGLHVPLMIRWPGQIEPGTTTDRLVSLMDLGPTVLSIAGVPIPGHMQGQAFLGEQAAPPRSYVYAARDRIDEAYDHVRAVRDARFKYIRNFMPDQPYILDVPYRNRMPTMQELLRLQASGQARGPVALWLRDRRDPEELYDTHADAHEIHNLAGDPRYADVLLRMRIELDRWIEASGDMGHIPEAEMVAQMWPGGTQPRTEPPVVDRAADGTVTISCPTEGASIAYTTETGDDPHWLLYTEPLVVEPGTTVRARAIRYGYAESEEVRSEG